MKIKKGDNVIVKTGKDAGKTGTVLRVLRSNNKVLVEGIGMMKKHKKSRAEKTKSQIIDMPTPVHVSNVMIVDPKSGKPSRIAIQKVDGKNVRVAKKSNAQLK